MGSARQTLEEALRPLAARMGGVVREHEILRVAASVGGRDAEQAAETARREVLAWAQNRSGGRLPPQAWKNDDFEYLAGGRNSVGVRIENDESDIWALRADDPDKNVPGRIWTTEVVVGLIRGQRPRFSARLLASTSEEEFTIDPHTPGFVQQVADTTGLFRGDYDLHAFPTLIEREEDADRLIELLIDPTRRLPVFVLSVPQGAFNAHEPMVDAASLSRATLGIAHVVILPAAFTWALTERFGKMHSVFGGAARAYLAGFNDESNPYDHRLVLAEQLDFYDAQRRCERWMRIVAAAESVRHNHLGRDVLAFATIRNASLRARQERLSSEGATADEQLTAAQARIAALEKAIDDEKAAQDYFDSEAKRSEERAAAAEAQHRASIFRIQQLEKQLRTRGSDLDAIAAPPASWAALANWCDINLVGRVTLTPAARRGVKMPLFEDLELVVRCLLWLATEYRDARMNGADRGLRDIYLEPGIRNSPCGGDEFDFDWQGRWHTADWHIKNGGNTRDPRRCLRIYHFWEPETQQVIVADMPLHRTSAIS